MYYLSDTILENKRHFQINFVQTFFSPVNDVGKTGNTAVSVDTYFANKTMKCTTLLLFCCLFQRKRVASAFETSYEDFTNDRLYSC